MKILTIIGTRPEAIKVASLIKSLSKHKNIKSKLCVTGQHKEMLESVLKIFNIKSDYDLKIMKKNQSLNSITSSVINKLKPILKDFKPDLVLVHGDTTSSFAAAIGAFYEKIEVGHIEAGLRTNDIYSPWPEEMNRKLISSIATYHFCPTKESKKNLLKEGFSPENIIVTGNTVIDSLFMAKKQLKKNKKTKKNIDKNFPFLSASKKLILVTGHRRENFEEGLINICNALKDISKEKNIEIIYPVHLNPNVQDPVFSILKNIDNIFLTPPLDYLSFIYLMNRAYIILTDSGGIQEEAPSLGKPVLVMRDKTERPEALKAGTVKLVGSSRKRIFEATKTLLENKKYYDQISSKYNPYGDGKASNRITKFILKN